MTYRRNLNFLFFLALSAAVHVAVLGTIASPIWDHLHGPGRRPAAREREVAVALIPPPDLQEPVMGEANGKGIGSNKSDGEQPLLAKEADEDQAFLTRDPPSPGRLGDLPAPDSGPLGEGGMGGQVGSDADLLTTPSPVTPIAPPPANVRSAQPADAPPPQAPIAIHLPDSVQAPSATDIQSSPVAHLDPPKISVPPLQPITPQPRVDPADLKLTRAAAPPRPTNGDGHAPGKPTAQANPAQPSDSDSDPFARIGSAVWRDGKLEIQAGRKVKTTRPRILLPGEVDLFTMGGASVVLKIAIDATGRVTDVDILKSSGSSVDIDQPCQLAVYDWWFEPTRDRNGRPIPDVLTFTIKFQ